RIGAKRALRPCMRSGRRATAPGPFAHLGERRGKTDTAVSDRIFYGFIPSVARKFCPRRHHLPALDLCMDSTNNWLRSRKRGAFGRGKEGCNGKGRRRLARRSAHIGVRGTVAAASRRPRADRDQED